MIRQILAIMVLATALPTADGAGAVEAIAKWKAYVLDAGEGADAFINVTLESTGDTGNHRAVVFGTHVETSQTYLFGYASTPRRGSGLRAHAGETDLAVAAEIIASSDQADHRQEWQDLTIGQWRFVVIAGVENPTADVNIDLRAVGGRVLSEAEGDGEYWLLSPGARLTTHHRAGALTMEARASRTWVAEHVAYYSLESFGRCVCRFEGPEGESTNTVTSWEAGELSRTVAGGGPGIRTLSLVARERDDTDPSRASHPDYGTADYPLQWLAADIPPW